MTQNQKTPTTNENQTATEASSPWLNRIDFLLLILCSVLIAGRCMIFETFPRARRWGIEPICGTEVIAMTVFAALIITLAFIWLIFRLKASSFTWRKTSLVIPFILFALGSGISYMAASNKHTARIDIWNLLSVTILGILLIQLLNAPWKRRFLLCVLAATGVVMGHRCWELHSHELVEMENNFLQDPNDALLQQGILPGTYAAEQFTNRVTSRDVGGYVGVSNTAAAFFILSIMATAALMLDRVQKKNLSQDWHFLLAGTLLLLIQIVGLWLTQSKGGIAGFLAAVGICVVFWIFRKPFQRHWRKVIVVCIILTIAGVIAVAAHGMVHDRLPTNSMWVRWQYWKASADMIADHWFTGVGPHNFGTYYLRYMDPAAPEEVKDPHCLPIALWSQWGLPGLIGFFWAVLAVGIRLARPQVKTPDENPTDDEPDEPKNLWRWGVVIAVAIMLLRLGFSDLPPSDTIIKKISVIVWHYLVPQTIWLIGFLLMLGMTYIRSHTFIKSIPPFRIGILVIGCGLLGFLLHNCIDFAFFQPGTGCFFFACVALAIAWRHSLQPDNHTGKSIRYILPALIIGAVLVLYLWLRVVIPVTASQLYMDRALASTDEAPNWLEKAAQQNPLDPEPHSLSFDIAQKNGRASLEKAVSSLQQAIHRDPANYSYYTSMSVMYRNVGYAQKAIEFAESSLDRYPENMGMLIYYADLLRYFGPYLQRENWRQETISLLERAIKNDDAFRQMRKDMFPEKTHQKTRLEKKIKNEAKDLLKQLQADSPQAQTK